MSGEKTTYEFYLPPPKMSKWEAFKLFLWNKEAGEVLGRNGKSWLLITIFYVIYYACLAAFFAAMLMVFYQTLHDDRPKWILGESIIGENPGLGFRPLPKAVGSTLVKVTVGGGDENDHLFVAMREFIKPLNKYTEDSMGKCSPKIGDNDVSCPFYIKNLGSECTEDNKFGYNDGQPCVILKLNKIFEWIPKAYNKTNLPEGMPQEAKTLITNLTLDDSLKYVWVTCEGEDAADKELLGEVDYYPYPGFSSKYYPFQNKKDYQSPYVMVRFRNPVRRVLIHVECKAWAENIEHARKEKRGVSRFEILIEGPDAVPM